MKTTVPLKLMERAENNEPSNFVVFACNEVLVSQWLY